MRRRFLMCTAYTIISLLMLSSCLISGDSEAADDDVVIEEFLSYTKSDFFDYDLDIDDWLTMVVEDDEDLTDYKEVTTKYKGTITGSEKAVVKSKSYDCWIMSWDVGIEYTLVGDGEDVDEIRSSMKLSARDWYCKDSFAVMKSEGIYEYVEEEYYPAGSFIEVLIYEEETVEKYSFTRVESKPPFPLRVGKTWSTQVAYTLNTTSKSRMKVDNYAYTDWEYYYDEEDFSETTNYEVISENENVVPAGTFETLKIKKQVKGESDYVFGFLDKYGMIIEQQMYDEWGTLSEIVSLKSYKYDQAKDSDSDGHIDIYDDFPYDPDEYMDTDDDGVGDNSDPFPDDPDEWEDSDGDGVGDNTDAFPFDETETVDTDRDGVGDNSDAFPTDAREAYDSDGDGVGNNADAFPYNANETRDSDNDGVGDNNDAFPYDPDETRDTDSDGTGDNTDAFPDDPAASVDTDLDGYPDRWNQGKSELNTTTGLKLDAYPNNALKWEEEPGTFDSALLLIAIAAVAGVIVVIAVILFFRRKQARKTSLTQPYVVTMQAQYQQPMQYPPMQPPVQPPMQPPQMPPQVPPQYQQPQQPYYPNRPPYQI